MLFKEIFFTFLSLIFLISSLDDGGTSCFIISVSQFDQSVVTEIFICLFTLHASLLKPQ